MAVLGGAGDGLPPAGNLSRGLSAGIAG